MYPLLPIDLTQQLEIKQKNIGNNQFIAKNELSNQKPTLVIVDEQPPKVQDIEPMKKSPSIDLFYEKMHVVGKLLLNRKKVICFQTIKLNTSILYNVPNIIILFQFLF